MVEEFASDSEDSLVDEPTLELEVDASVEEIESIIETRRITDVNQVPAVPRHPEVDYFAEKDKLAREEITRKLANAPVPVEGSRSISRYNLLRRQPTRDDFNLSKFEVSP